MGTAIGRASRVCAIFCVLAWSPTRSLAHEEKLGRSELEAVGSIVSMAKSAPRASSEEIRKYVAFVRSATAELSAHQLRQVLVDGGIPDLSPEDSAALRRSVRAALYGRRIGSEQAPRHLAAWQLTGGTPRDLCQATRTLMEERELEGLTRVATQLVMDDRPAVRRVAGRLSAALTMAGHGGSTLDSVLIRLLKDKDPDTAGMTAWWFAMRLNRPAIAKCAVERLQDQRPVTFLPGLAVGEVVERAIRGYAFTMAGLEQQGFDLPESLKDRKDLQDWLSPLPPGWAQPLAGDWGLLLDRTVILARGESISVDTEFGGIAFRLDSYAESIVGEKPIAAASYTFSVDERPILGRKFDDLYDYTPDIFTGGNPRTREWSIWMTCLGESARGVRCRLQCWTK